MLVGLYDLNTEFDALESAGLFLNSSQGIGPEFAQSGLNGPSIFPTTTLGLRAKWAPGSRFYLESVVLNGLAGSEVRSSACDQSKHESGAEKRHCFRPASPDCLLVSPG